MPDEAHSGPPLISKFYYNPVLYNTLSKLKHFETVCCSKDGLTDFEHWSMNMANLESLSVKCIHTHTKLDSQLTCQVEDWEWMLLVTDLVESLAVGVGCTSNLEEISMDGILFKSGKLLDMVE